MRTKATVTNTVAWHLQTALDVCVLLLRPSLDILTNRALAPGKRKPSKPTRNRTVGTELLPARGAAGVDGVGLPDGYGPVLAELKSRVRSAQLKAAVSVNRELILLYWHIGSEILRCQNEQRWGAKVVDRLSRDLRAEFPEMSGFST